MELWIRSQDKESLLLVKEIWIKKDNSGLYGLWNDNQNTYLRYCLGYYKTKERALEILDDIQFYLRAKNELFIYEMPKE